MKTLHKISSVIVATLLMNTTVVLAAELSAGDIAKKAYDYLDGQTQYTFDAINISHIGENANKHTISAKVNRPNQLRLDIRGDVKNRSNYINNGTYTVYEPDKNMYLHLKIPKNIDGALDSIYDKFEAKIPVAQLLYKNMGSRMQKEKGYTSKNFGIVDLNGEQCHYIAFADKYKEIHAWVSTGDKPLIKHYLIKDKVKNENIFNETTIIWKDAKTISAKDFDFTAPKNAVEVFINDK